MSFMRTQAVWGSSKAKGGELLVLLALADHENDKTGQINPCIKKLAKETRMSVRQCKTYLARLQKRQELSVKRTRGASRYTINLSIQEVQNPALLKQVRSAESRTAEVQRPAHRIYNPNQEGEAPPISPTPWGKEDRRSKIKGTESGESDYQIQPVQNMCPGDPAKVSARTTLPSTPRARRNPQPLSDDARNRFERVWKAYPKKMGYGLAEKAWLAVERDNNVDEAFMATLLSKIEQAKKTGGWIKEDGKFIPYPEKWLSAKGWMDEYPGRVTRLAY